MYLLLWRAYQLAQQDGSIPLGQVTPQKIDQADITGALGVNVVERLVLEMRDPTKKLGRPEGRPNAAFKRLEEELAGEDHISNSGSESGDGASLGWRVEEVIQAAEVGVTQIGTRRSIV